jgi:CheY-like chemotaxis protein
MLMLQRLGYYVDAVTNGLEAIRAMESRRYDLILMDLVMPVMDGITAAKEIRSRWPENGLKIIAFTAYILPDGREICLSAGMNDYICKPVTLEMLRAAIEKNLPPHSSGIDRRQGVSC